MKTPEDTTVQEQDPVYQGLGFRICIGLLIIALFGGTVAGFALYASARQQLADSDTYRRRDEKLIMRLIEELDIVKSAYTHDTAYFYELSPEYGPTDSEGNRLVNASAYGAETGVLRWCTVERSEEEDATYTVFSDHKPEIVRPDSTIFAAPPGITGFELSIVKKRPETLPKN